MVFCKKNRFRLNISKISISVNSLEKISISFKNFENLYFVQHFRKEFDFGSKYVKSRFRSTFSKNFRFQFKIWKISTSVKIFWKKFRFRFKISKISTSISILEKISISLKISKTSTFWKKKSISVKNFENLDFGQHFLKKFDFRSKFRKSRFRSAFSKKFRFLFKISKTSITVNIFEIKNRFWLKISKLWILVNNFEKISISF